MVIRIVTYLFVVCGISFLALYIGENSLAAIVCSMLLIPVCSIMMLLISFFRLRYEEIVDKLQVERNENITYTLTVKNRDFFIYPSVNIHFKENSGLGLGGRQDVCILPRNQYDIVQNITCSHIGQYDIGVRGIELWDFFRFVKIKVRMKENRITIDVLPKIITLESFKAITGGEYNGSHNGHNSQAEDRTEILDIRRYERHLPLKYIHWKVSAKRNELMVKKYDMMEDKMVYLFVDIGKYGTPDDHKRIQDIVVETVIAISKYSVERNIPVTVCFNNESLTVVKITDSYGFHMFYHSISRMQLDKAVDIEYVIEKYQHKGIHMNSMLVITSNISVDLQNLLIHAVKIRAKAALVYPVPDIHHENADVIQLMEDLNEKSVYSYSIAQADDIKNILEK